MISIKFILARWSSENDSADKSIVLRITYKRQVTEIKTECKATVRTLNPNPVNEKANWVIGTTSQTRLVNEKLKIRYNKALAVILGYEVHGYPESVKQISNDIRDVWNKTLDSDNNKVDSEVDFIQFIDSYAESRKNIISYRRIRVYYQLAEKLKAFSKSNVLLFADINLRFTQSFQAYLSKRKLHQNTIVADLKCMKALLNAAKKEKLIDSTDVFPSGFTRTITNIKSVLTEKEVKALQDVNLDIDSQIWHARNIFLMQLYCAGTRAGDMLTMRWSNYVDGMLVFIASKTGKPRTIKLMPQALAIIEQYRSPKNHPDDVIFPIVHKRLTHFKNEYSKSPVDSVLAIYNKNLKLLAETCGIRKKLTSHISRHTFAVMALEKTGDVYKVSKSLGHNNLATTQIYLNSLNNGLVDDILDTTFGSESSDN